MVPRIASDGCRSMCWSAVPATTSHGLLSNPMLPCYFECKQFFHCVFIHNVSYAVMWESGSSIWPQLADCKPAMIFKVNQSKNTRLLIGRCNFQVNCSALPAYVHIHSSASARVQSSWYEVCLRGLQWESWRRVQHMLRENVILNAALAELNSLCCCCCCEGHHFLLLLRRSLVSAEQAVHSLV